MNIVLMWIGLLIFTVSEQIRFFAFGIEQRLFIDLGKHSRESDDSYYYSKGYGSERNGYGGNGYGGGRRGADYSTRRGDYGDEPERTGNGFGLSGISASSRTNYVQPPYASSTTSIASPTSSARDGLPNSITDLKNLIKQMDRTFSDRLNSLSGRVDRLEANQNSFRRSVMAEWQPLNSIDKRIRLFNSAKNTWREAEEICQANTGRLLHIESPDENQQIAELLRTVSSPNDDDRSEGDTLYWIGMQSTLAFNIPTQNFTNFDVNKPHKRNNTATDISGNFSIVEEGDDTSAEDNSAEQLEEEDGESGHAAESTTVNGDAVIDGGRRRSESLHDKFRRGCAAISTARNGKWISRDCEERHQFICQL